MYVDKRTSGSGPVPQGCRAGPRDPGTRGRGQAGSARPRQITPEGGSMSTLPAVTMQDLELEHAELLPSRENLTHGGRGFSVTQAGQFGLLNVGPILSGNAVAVSVLGSSTAVGGGNIGIGNA